MHERLADDFFDKLPLTSSHKIRTTIPTIRLLNQPELFALLIVRVVIQGPVLQNVWTA